MLKTLRTIFGLRVCVCVKTVTEHVSQVQDQLSSFFTCYSLQAPFSGCRKDKKNLSVKKKKTFKFLKVNVIHSRFLKTLLLPFQVGVHIIKAMIFSQINQHSRSTASVSGPTEAAVTDPSAWRTLPLLTTDRRN